MTIWALLHGITSFEIAGTYPDLEIEARLLIESAFARMLDADVTTEDRA